jgi:hypothetical protein
MVASFAELNVQEKALNNAAVKTKQQRGKASRSAISPPSRLPKASKKTQESDATPPPAPEPEPVSGSNTPTTNTNHATKLLASTVRVTNLPEFANINSEWRSRFLPTLWLTFYNSSDLFDRFALSSQSLLVTVQQTVDTVYPNVTYRVRIKDEPFYLLVRLFCV